MVRSIALETDRLYLRQWQDEDLEPFAAINADPGVMEFLPQRLERQDSDALAIRLRSLIEQRDWGLWAVEVKSTVSFIGFVGLNIPTVNLPFSPCVEVGWRLAAAHWGHGYASEAAQRVLSFAFDQLQLPEVVSFTTVGNHRSRRVMQRIGLHWSGEFEHPSLPEGNPLRRHVLYRLSYKEWRA